jgi:hypothetical protein
MALPPQERYYGGRRALLPIDPTGGGTWVAVNDAGLAMTLLNATGGRLPRPRVPLSRGSVVPALLGCGSLDEAIQGALALGPHLYAPFRLVLASADEVAELISDSERLTLARRVRLDAPYLFTSSGLGDELVQAPRVKLFGDHFRPALDWATAQDAFHRHSWPEYPHLSVCMRRPGTETVSHTIASAAAGRAAITYHANAPDRNGPVFVRHIALLGGGQ